MNEPETHIRRILLALDSSVTAPDSLETATELASRLRAELQGLFVEDDELLRCAALPFVSQVNLSTGAQQPLERRELELQMAGLAAMARQRLAVVAERVRVTWSFRTVRGRIANEVASAAQTADLVIVDGGRRGGPAQSRIGMPAKDTVKRVGQSVLILRAGRKLGNSVAVLFDDTAQGEKALRLAATVAQGSAALRVFVPSEVTPDWEARVRALLDGVPVGAKIESLRSESISRMREQLVADGSGLAVMAADNPIVNSADIAELLDSLSCAVLLVR